MEKFLESSNFLLLVVLTPITISMVVFIRSFLKTFSFEKWLEYSERRDIRVMEAEQRKNLLERNIVILQHPNGNVQIVQPADLGAEKKEPTNG